MSKVGVVLGKFCPLHKGHELLINTALKECDRVHIFVCTLSTEPIDGNIRATWMVNRYQEYMDNGSVKIYHISEDWIPQEPKDCKSRNIFYGTWAGILKALTQEKIDYIYASEDYVYPMALFLDCKARLLDIDRNTIPISGTAIRKNPIKYWNYMNEDVRNYFTKKVLIIGGESTGKTSLTKQLQEFCNNRGFKALGILEYARQWIDENLEGDVDELKFEDISMFGKTQMTFVNTLPKHYDAQIVFSDTDAITSKVFQDIYFGEYDDELEDLANEATWDLILLLHPDVPWVDDGQRNLGNEHMRDVHFKYLKSELHKRGLTYVDIKGTWEERFKIATNAVNKILGV